MRLKDWEVERLLLTSAMLVTYYRDRNQIRPYDPFDVLASGPSHIPWATEALCQYVLDRRNEIFALKLPLIAWVEANLEEALEIAADADQVSEAR